MGWAPLEIPKNHHWGHPWGTKFPKKTVIGRVGVATIGAEQHTFRTTVPGLNGWGTIGKPEQTIIGTTHGEPNFGEINYGAG